jgi:hypothetical protein
MIFLAFFLELLVSLSLCGPKFAMPVMRHNVFEYLAAILYSEFMCEHFRHKCF